MTVSHRNMTRARSATPLKAQPIAHDSRHWQIVAVAVAMALAATLLVTPVFADATSDAVASALTSDIRTDAERARDRNRKPAQTLEFFGFERDMRVIEIFPGGGWYAKILAPVLRERGEYFAIGGLGAGYGFPLDLSGTEDVAGMDRVKVIDISGSLSPNPTDRTQTAESIDFGVEEADLVLTFRNLHNLSAAGRAAMFKAAYASLRPGGRFGAIDHTRRHMQGAWSENWRRLDPVLVIKEATAAGFHLLDYSTLHYRADDELLYEVGRASVRGNTDRFTLLFEK